MSNSRKAVPAIRANEEPKVETAAEVALHGVELLIESAGSLASALDRDPDTSMVESLTLHLLSEHGLAAALKKTPEDQDRLHRDLHLKAIRDHSVADQRFRPGRGMQVLALAFQRRDAVAKIVAPRAPRRTA